MVQVVLDCCNVSVFYMKWYESNKKWTVKSEEYILKSLDETKNKQRSLAKNPKRKLRQNSENILKM